MSQKLAGSVQTFLIHPKESKRIKGGEMKKLLMIIPLVILLCFTYGCQQGEEIAEEPVVDAAEKEAEPTIIIDNAISADGVSIAYEVVSRTFDFEVIVDSLPFACQIRRLNIHKVSDKPVRDPRKPENPFPAPAGIAGSTFRLQNHNSDGNPGSLLPRGEL